MYTYISTTWRIPFCYVSHERIKHVCSSYSSSNFLPASQLMPCLPWVHQSVRRKESLLHCCAATMEKEYSNSSENYKQNCHMIQRSHSWVYIQTNYNLKRYLHLPPPPPCIFVAALFTRARTWKQFKCPSTDKWRRAPISQLTAEPPWQEDAGATRKESHIQGRRRVHSEMEGGMQSG